MRENNPFTYALKCGTRVRALRMVDEGAANARPGAEGYVLEEANAHEDACGPVIQWDRGGMCNVYDGDVEVVDAP